MSIEIVYDETNLLRLWKISLDQVPPAVGEVLFRAPFGHGRVSPAVFGGKEHKEVTGAVALVLMIGNV
jgi:hypothetical protein